MGENLKKRKRCTSRINPKSSSITAREKILLEKSNFSQLCTYVSCDGRKTQSLKFSRVFFRESIRLVSSNLFRPLPHSSDNNVASTIQFGESFYINWNKAKKLTNTNSFQDPAWPDHLELVYRFLFSLLKSPRTDPILLTPCIHPSFVLNLLDLFQSEDSRERNALRSVFKLLYQKFNSHRQFIAKSVFNVFYCCVNGNHIGITELLLFLKSIVEEEEDNEFGVPEELKIFLVRGLIPLYKSKRLVLFAPHLNSCIEKFVQTDCELAETVIQGMLRHWPVAGSSREYFFLDGVERVLWETKPGVAQHLMMIPLFHRIAGCLGSPHYMVAEKALSLFKIHGNIQNLIKQNIDVILPIIFTDLETNARNHWQPQIHELANRVGNSLFDMEPELFNSCWMHMT